MLTLNFILVLSFHTFLNGVNDFEVILNNHNINYKVKVTLMYLLRTI